MESSDEPGTPGTSTESIAPPNVPHSQGKSTLRAKVGVMLCYGMAVRWKSQSE